VRWRHEREHGVVPGQEMDRDGHAPA
jgi:hypothetical protein